MLSAFKFDAIPRPRFLWFITTALVFIASGTSSGEPPADLVLTGGNVITVDEANPRAEAIACRGDRILAVGSDADIKRLIGPETKVISLAGKTVVPGFIEGHGHFLGLGRSRMILDLTGAKSWGEVVELVRKAAETAEPGEWILGRGWHQSKWDRPPEPNVEGYPLHADLSRVSPRNPVELTHASGHMTIVNEQALHIAGITKATSDPRGGTILRDARGEPTGVLRETAQSLVVVDETAGVSNERDRRAIELATEECLRKGVTSFQDAGASFRDIDHFRELAESGQLRVRLWVMVRESNGGLARGLGRYRTIGAGNHFLTVRGIKQMIDGALGSQGAWLLEPYADLPESRGLQLISLEYLAETARLAREHGYQLCVHAIGDRANREVLDLFEREFTNDGGRLPSDLRWRIEHAQHLHPDDIPRFSKLGIIASMQGTHATSDAPFVVSRLGEERARVGAYAWKSLLDSGAKIVNGTDVPVENVDPLASFYASVTRKLPDGRTFFPEQSMTRMQALRSYTTDAAYAAFEEDLKGSLSVGKLADLVVLSRDILTCPEDEILKTQVELTVVGGKVVFERMGDSRTSAASVVEADVVVYGATPGGFCAAIAAAREGASVVLLEPTDHIGGVNTGGLSFSDSNQTARSTLMGLFDEWHTRIEKDYESRGITLPYKVSVKDQSTWTYEPHVAMRVTKQMLDEAKVRVLTRRVLERVVKDDSRIVSVVTTDGTFAAKVFVDATYEGDLMAASGVSWTIGREGRSEFGESLAGKQYPKATMKIDGFDADGNPLPLITATELGPAEAGDKNVMTYSFRLCLTEDPANRVPFPQPANYDPARFEVMRRYLRAGGNVGWDLYPLPGNKFDGNNSIGGQFSLGLIGACNDWCEADAAGRAAIWEAHKQYTLEFVHFLTTDPAVPAKVRERYARLGLCRDEFPEYGHFSPALYVREGRRMRGLYVLSQKDILDETTKDDPIAVSSFPIDSHDCRRIALPDGGVINEGTIFPVRMKNPKRGYAYHVPYRSILPKSDECSNLLVPVALSCTHVGISSIRVEPTWMVLGQSAGIAAALCSRSERPVHELPYPQLRERLIAQGQVLTLPAPVPDDANTGGIDPKTFPGIVLDDEQAELSGSWSRSTSFQPYLGKGYVYCGDRGPAARGDGQSAATFRFKSQKTGRFQVLMAYSAHETRATNVPLTVVSGSATRTFAVDQTQSLPDGKRFRPIGTVDLTAGAESTITISNHETSGFVILDALQLLEVE